MFLDARSKAMFRNVNSYMDEGMLQAITGKCYLYCFQFDPGSSSTGLLRIYRPKVGSEPNVNPCQDWAYKDALWFRELSYQGADGYEAFIEYDHDFQDPICVDLHLPLMEMRVPSVMQAMIKKIQQLAPQLPTQVPLFG